VVVMHSTVKSSPTSSGINGQLPGTAKLTTRFFFSADYRSQSESSLFGFEPPKVRSKCGPTRSAFRSVSASYGF